MSVFCGVRLPDLLAARLEEEMVHRKMNRLIFKPPYAKINRNVY